MRNRLKKMLVAGFLESNPVGKMLLERYDAAAGGGGGVGGGQPPIQIVHHDEQARRERPADADGWAAPQTFRALWADEADRRRFGRYAATAGTEIQDRFDFLEAVEQFRQSLDPAARKAIADTFVRAGGNRRVVDDMDQLEVQLFNQRMGREQDPAVFENQVQSVLIWCHNNALAGFVSWMQDPANQADPGAGSAPAMQASDDDESPDVDDVVAEFLAEHPDLDNVTRGELLHWATSNRDRLTGQTNEEIWAELVRAERLVTARATLARPADLDAVVDEFLAQQPDMDNIVQGEFLHWVSTNREGLTATREEIWAQLLRRARLLEARSRLSEQEPSVAEAAEPGQPVGKAPRADEEDFDASDEEDPSVEETGEDEPPGAKAPPADQVLADLVAADDQLADDLAELSEDQLAALADEVAGLLAEGSTRT